MLRTGNRETFISLCNQEPEDSSGHLKDLRNPTLILWGSDDAIIPPRYAERFHKDIPGSQVIVYDGVGHIPQEVVPEKIAADMRSFL
jgi:pimeloyl-ACP methyl ester carboxylesterase